MNTSTIARPRIQPAVAGKSGSRTLQGLSLAQDKERRAELQKKDVAAYLAKGGLQPETTTFTAELRMQQEIADLFSANDWSTFSTI